MSNSDIRVMPLERSDFPLTHFARAIAIAGLLGILVGLGWGLLTTRMYVSAATFIPQQSESGSSGLAMAASQFGISLPAGGGGWGPSVYVALLRSRTILEPIAMGSFSTSPEDPTARRMSDLLEVTASSDARRIALTLRALGEVVKVREDAKLGRSVERAERDVAAARAHPRAPAAQRRR